MIEHVLLTRRWSWFLFAAGIFNWVIWPRLSVAIWQDSRAWSGAVGSSAPTAFLWVHAVLVVTAVTVGTVVGVLGLRGLLAFRRSSAELPEQLDRLRPSGSGEIRLPSPPA